MGSEQKCGRCKTAKPMEAFSPSYRGKPGTWCKPCFNAHHRGEPAPEVEHDSRPCGYCGKEYVPKHLKAIGRFCSRECGQADRRDSGRQRDRYLKRTYGISAVDYDRLLAEQGGGCALCGVKPEDLKAGRYRTYLHVDHCHETGRIRGLLCPEDNLLLGRFGDSPERFRRVLEYLEASASDT